MFRAVMISTALSLAAFPLLTASNMSPDLNASDAAAQLSFSEASPAFASSSLARSTPAGSFLLCERMSTRLLMTSAIFGTPLLISSQLFVSSDFLVATAAPSSLAFAVASCAPASAALKSFFSKLARAAATASWADLTWSGTYFIASPLTASIAFCAALIAAAAGAFSALSQAARVTMAMAMTMPIAIRCIRPPSCADVGGVRALGNAQTLAHSNQIRVLDRVLVRLEDLGVQRAVTVVL